ncbi:DMT family transporter [Aminiphilus sp.]|uniref:DMT family transporter n=1 Tax=Aminiphilus sp. TaxID=1872488 RepID=UPI00260C2A03|nr:DMT family transporter [Aminiphilus sp.]
MTLAGLLLCAGTAICWASSPLLLREGMKSFSYQEINAVRSLGFLGGSIVVLLTLLGTSATFPTSPFLLGVVLCNVLLGNILGDVAYFAAIKSIGVSRAVAISSAYPLVVTAVSWLWLGEHITLHVLAGTVCIVLGLVFLRMEGHDREQPQAATKGFLLSILAALCWGIGIPISKWLISSAGMDPVTFNFLRALTLVPLTWGIWLSSAKGRREAKTFLSRRDETSRGDNAVSAGKTLALRRLSVVLAGVVGLSLGGVLFTLSLRTAPVSLVTPITATSPFLTALFSFFVLREPTRAVQWAGIAFIVGGSAAIGM